MSAPLILDAVSISLGGRLLIPPLTLAIAAGEAATVMGPSGCGKSSLLAYICGTLDPAFRAGGSVLLGADELTQLPPERRRVGILFQDDLLFPHLSVGENLGFGLPAEQRGRGTRQARIESALAESGLAGFAGRDPATLSGGQRARVALLRTLLAEPNALLLDEPFGRLDAGLRERFRRLVLDHARARRLPVLLVTHEPTDAAAAGGRVIVIDRAEEVPAPIAGEPLPGLRPAPFTEPW